MHHKCNIVFLENSKNIQRFTKYYLVSFVFDKFLHCSHSHSIFIILKMLSSNLKLNASENDDIFGFSTNDIKAEVKRAYKLVGQR